MDLKLIKSVNQNQAVGIGLTCVLTALSFLVFNLSMGCTPQRISKGFVGSPLSAQENSADQASISFSGELLTLRVQGPSVIFKGSCSKFTLTFWNSEGEVVPAPIGTVVALQSTLSGNYSSTDGLCDSQNVASLSIGDSSLQRTIYLSQSTLGSVQLLFSPQSSGFQGDVSLDALVQEIPELPGVFDTTFATVGIAHADVKGYQNLAAGLVVQPDGKAIIAGYSEVGARYNEYGAYLFSMLRFLTDGSLDTSFGNFGRVVTGVGDTLATGTRDDGAKAVALQADGKILLGGYTKYDDPDRGGYGYDSGLVRYLSDGSLDRSFAQNGILRTNMNPGSYEQIEEIVVRPNGKILCAGYSTDDNWYVLGFFLLQLLPDGTPDASFGPGGNGYSFRDLASMVSGATTADDGEDDYNDIDGLVLLPDGSALISGTIYDKRNPSVGNFHAVVAKFTPSGSLDSTFGNYEISGSKSGLMVELGPLSGKTYGYSVTVGTQNRFYLLVRDSTNNSFGAGRVCAYDQSTGDLDLSFGGSNSGCKSMNKVINSISLQPDGKIIVGGSGTEPGVIPSSLFGVTRLTLSGEFDPTFGDAFGSVNELDVAMDVTITQKTVKKVFVGPSGAIYMGGYGRASLFQRFLVARLWP